MSKKYFANQLSGAGIGAEKLRRRQKFMKHMESKLRLKQTLYSTRRPRHVIAK